MPNNAEQQLYGIAAQYRSLRRLWLQYIFSTAALIVILLFACNLALLISLATDKMISDYIVASILTMYLSALTLIHAKYSPVRKQYFN